MLSLLKWCLITYNLNNDTHCLGQNHAHSNEWKSLGQTHNHPYFRQSAWWLQMALCLNLKSFEFCRGLTAPGLSKDILCNAKPLQSHHKSETPLGWYIPTQITKDDWSDHMQNHQVDSPLYLWPDIWSAEICNFIKCIVIHDTECPYWDQVSFHNTKPNHKSEKNTIYKTKERRKKIQVCFIAEIFFFNVMTNISINVTFICHYYQRHNHQRSTPIAFWNSLNHNYNFI